MVRNIVRRAGTTAAVLAVAGGTVVAAAPSAQAATAAQCIQHIKGGTFENPYLIVAPRQKLQAISLPLVNRTCYNMRVSIGISKTDLSGFRNQAAFRQNKSANRYAFKSVFSSLPGKWMVRQIAVADASGRIAVKKFTNPGPRITEAISESRLTGKPTGDIRLDPGRGGFFFGYLKAYTRYGTWAPLAPKQRIQLQARPHGTRLAYRTVALGSTSRSGYYQIAVHVPRGRWDVRVAYVAPYRSVASDVTWLGVTR